MNAALVVSVITIVISLLSLTVSGALVLRQTRIARDGYALPVVVSLFSQFREDAFFRAEQYVLHTFRDEFPETRGVTELPAEARAHLRKVCNLYDDLGALVAHGIIREQLVIGSRGRAIRRVWERVAPFVLQERAQRGSSLWIYLEDLAARAAATPPDEIHAALRLRSFPQPPAPRDDPADDETSGADGRGDIR